MKDAKLADALMEDYRTAPVDPEIKQLLSFAEKIARDASQMTPDEIASLHSAGFSDRALLDAAHVAGFFSYMNRVVQTFGADAKTRNIAMGEKVMQSFFSEPGLAPSEK